MIDYSNVVFALVKPPSRIVSTHKARDSSEHKELLKRAIERQLYLYYADTEIIDGKVFAKQPWKLDWDSVVENQQIEQKIPEKCQEQDKEPEIEQVSEQEIISEPEQDELKCPVCGKKCTSTPGRTLHVKSKHPEHFEEYKKSIK